MKGVKRQRMPDNKEVVCLKDKLVPFCRKMKYLPSPNFCQVDGENKKNCMLKQTVHVNDNGRFVWPKQCTLCVEAWHKNSCTEVALPHLISKLPNPGSLCNRTHNVLQDNLIQGFSLPTSHYFNISHEMEEPYCA